eukprot:CAMPEP_0201533350 /NCGR_PEP_ID=MMETSP0161_2-20130828/52934_1 /ASSEMBLY_ACC=CAM_ASM_000251 /TAXON_ID=180227 /ORGANISM="Neoparamoeba aestuarina, Strain SoJaBio B1-5/56/2" /LENGTH=583 /DNA_ID=CAMNT_0047937301 /DNA_START=31 /DNA_END=1782 /DNA_ORIENTATION=-
MAEIDRKQQAVISRPIWQPDSAARYCKKCREEFGFFLRKHHCRGCGYIFCDPCTSNSVQFPEEWGYSEKQRVCVKCMIRITSDQDLSRLTKEELLMLKFFLRESQIYRIRSKAKDITRLGSRVSPQKTPVLVEFQNPNNPKRMFAEDQNHILTLMDTSHAPAPLTDQSKKKWAKMLYGLEHPFIAPVLEADVLTEKGRVVFFRELYPKGSLKDAIYGCSDPLQPFSKKYPNRMNFDKYDEVLGLPDSVILAKCRSSLKLPTIQLFGRQILEGLSYLNRCNVPYPYLHTGNVLLLEKETGNLLEKKKYARLSDFENVTCGLKPHYCLTLPNTSPEVECFGNVLFEMTMGFPRYPNLLSRKKYLKIPKSCPPDVIEVLESIFTKSGGQTIEGLLQMPFFASVDLKLPDPLPIKFKGMTKGMAAYLQTYREYTEKNVQSVYQDTLAKAKTYVDEKTRSLNDVEYGSSGDIRLNELRSFDKPGEQAIRAMSPSESSDAVDLPDDRRQKRKTKKIKSSQLSSTPTSSSPLSSSPSSPPPPAAPPPPSAPASTPPSSKGRGALLDSIRDPDVKLKKTKTVDKSIPKHLR